MYSFGPIQSQASDYLFIQAWHIDRRNKRFWRSSDLLSYQPVVCSRPRAAKGVILRSSSRETESYWDFWGTDIPVHILQKNLITSDHDLEKLNKCPLNKAPLCIFLGSNLRIDCICFHIYLRLSDDFSGAATTPFSREITQVLMSPINEADVEIKPDGKLV